MFKFEGAIIKKEENKKPQEKTVFQKIRNNSEIINTGFQVLSVGSLATGLGVGIGEIERKIRQDINKNKIELFQEKERAESYLVRGNKVASDTTKYLSDDFISEVAILMKGPDEASLIKGKDGLIAVYLSSGTCERQMSKEDTLNYERILNKYESDIKEEKKKLNIKDINTAKEKIIDIMTLIEKAKLEVINHIESDEYLEKLGKEIGISKKLARLHQEVRINNIKNISYNLVTNTRIFMDTDGGGYAYYSPLTNKITLPYNIDLNDKNKKSFFCEAIVHEILHESTMYDEGLSGTVEEFLRDSFKNSENENREDSIYYSEPGELIVRKQILDLEMEKLGIKKYGDVFTEEHYKKLKELRDKYELSSDAIQFIDHIKPQNFVKVMNELADNNSREEKGDYYNPEWNYDENQT